MRKEIYQKVYSDKNSTYGLANHGHCPGVRLYPYYYRFLIDPIIDFGCGTGDNVRVLRKDGHEADGIDWIDLNNGMMVGDITEIGKFDKYQTSLCMDVIEHIPNKGIIGLFTNMMQTTIQVFSISNTKSINKIDGEEMDFHINKKTFEQWRHIIEDYFDIVQEIEIRKDQHLYLTKIKRSIYETKC